MKKLISILCFLVLFLYLACNQTTITSPNINSPSGEITLKINRSTTPQNVVLITASLTRNGYNSIVDTLNIVTDTSGYLNILSVPVGQWHLLVEALDANSNVIYSGETDVTIIENETTSVILTLLPAGSGTGSISIEVNWGTNNIWTEYMDNPLIGSSNNSYDTFGVLEPKILFENGIYKMWYAGLTYNSRACVLYAESVDGINWTKYPNPVLTPSVNMWDSNSTLPGAIINDGNQYKMYYVGWTNYLNHWNIGLATSPDGKNWTKYPNPVILGTSGWEYQVIPSAVFKINGTYRLYYMGRNAPYYKLGYATSSDGIQWNQNDNPIMEPNLLWEGTAIKHPSILIENNKYIMVYGNSSNSAFGMAVSSDGLNWQKYGVPFFELQNTNSSWESSGIAYPCLVNVNNQNKIYYNGINSMTVYEIGLLIEN